MSSDTIGDIGGVLERPRLLHTMLRVRDLDRSLVFYRDALGMTVQRRLDFTDACFSLVYLGYGDDRLHTVVELTWNWHQAEDYSHGNGYGHIGIGVPNLHGFCAMLEARGVPIVLQPRTMASTDIHIAFITDPDGYKIELIQAPFPLTNMDRHMLYPTPASGASA